MTLCPHCGSTYVERMGLRLIFETLIYEGESYRLRSHEAKVLDVLLRLETTNKEMLAFYKPSMIKVTIWRLRVKFEDYGLPFKIINTYDLSYRLVKQHANNPPKYT